MDDRRFAALLAYVGFDASASERLRELHAVAGGALPMPLFAAEGGTSPAFGRRSQKRVVAISGSCPGQARTRALSVIAGTPARAEASTNS